jgi:hypothetical protein
MGAGFLRRKKIAKMAAEVQQMREETQRLVEDPGGAFQKMAKPLLTQLQAATYEKNKLSALVCALLEASGGTVVIKRADIDQFQRHRITILSETNPEDDGVNPEVAITFSYRAEFVPQPPIDQPPSEAAPKTTTDVCPDCGMPEGQAAECNSTRHPQDAVAAGAGAQPTDAKETTSGPEVTN